MRVTPPRIDSPAEQRRRMVTQQLRGRGIRDQRVLAAMATVPREVFVPETERDLAYSDRPLPLGRGQTISQPLMVALMLEALRLSGHERVLEVGTGHGYQAALLAELAREVYTLEVIPELAEQARRNLDALNIHNAQVIVADGSVGYPSAAPYDAIVVAAAAPAVPPPLLEQLAAGGSLVVPVGNCFAQVLRRLNKTKDGIIEREQLCGCVFVPLVGAHGM